MKIRDEFQMTMDAYRTLYECSLSFGIRKSLPAENRQLDVQNRLTALETKKQIIKDDLASAIATYETIQRQEVEQRMIEEKIYNDEIIFLKKNKTQLEAFIEGIQKKSNNEKIIQEN